MMQNVDLEQSNDESPDPLEDSVLARRLRSMTWPSAPPGVKERCLDEILAELGVGQADTCPAQSGS